jgi:hypothetical protein
MTKPSNSKNKTFSRWGLNIGLAVAAMVVGQNASADQATIPLGSAGKFAVLAATTVTSSGATTINGNLGVSPGNTVTGSPIVNGTMHLGDPTAAQAQLDLTTAYNDAAGRLGGASVSGNLGGLTKTPGLYTSTSSLEITSGDLTLDAQGDPNAVFIFQIPTTFITTVGRQVILAGGATWCHVFWQVGSSATFGTDSIIKGNILAYTSITLNGGASLEGRALAQNGAVALENNLIAAIPTASPPAPSFAGISRTPNGLVTLIINNTPCRTLTLQTSADLKSWTTLTTLTPGASPYTFTDTTASAEPMRFYRALYDL